MSKGKIRDVSPDRVENSAPEIHGKVSEVVEPEDVPDKPDIPRMIRRAYDAQEYDDPVVVLRPEGVTLFQRTWARLTRGPPQYMSFVMVPRDKRPSEDEYVAVEASRVRMPVPQSWRAER